MNLRRVIIIQPLVPQYRVPFFKALAEMYGEKITILHFGNKVSFDHHLISEVIAKRIVWNGLNWVKSLNDILKNYDTVVTFFDPHWINLFILPFNSKKKKIILWGHGFGKNKIIKWARVLLFKKADSIITYSEERKKKIVSAGINSEKVFVANNTIEISNSTDTSRFKKCDFIFVGRLQRRKKLDVFLEIFSKNSLGEKGYRFVIVGDGPDERKFLDDYATILGIRDYIDFVDGTTDNDILFEYFSKSLYYISPGAVGLGVLHSFAYGVPVLTMEDINHGPEVENIQQNINGYVFKNKLEFNSCFADFLENERHILMGFNAFNFFCNERSVNNMAKEFINALKSVE